MERADTQTKARADRHARDYLSVCPDPDAWSG